MLTISEFRLVAPVNNALDPVGEPHGCKEGRPQKLLAIFLPTVLAPTRPPTEHWALILPGHRPATNP